MAEEESFQEQLQGLSLVKLAHILLDLHSKLGHPLSSVEEAPTERKDLIQAIEEVVEERPQVKRLRKREEELRVAREAEERRERERREAEERRLRELKEEEERKERERKLEEARMERERKEAEERRLKELREEEERKERERKEAEERRARAEREFQERCRAHERALRASPTWPVRWGAYLQALPREEREAHLRSLSSKQLVRHLEESGIDPAMPPVEKDDYIAVLAESSAERIDRERRALEEQLRRERQEAEERAAREEQELRARAEEEERRRREAELAELQRVEARERWDALATASQSEREAFLESKTLDELKEMLAEADFEPSTTPVVKYDLVVLLAQPPDERRRQEEARAAARREVEDLKRRLAEELERWESSPEWRSRRLAYIRALPLVARRAYFGTRLVSELRQLVSLAGLSPACPAAAAGDDAERQPLIDALVEPAAERCGRLWRAREEERAERERERLRKEQEGPGSADREAYMRRSVKELRQMLRERGISDADATEKQDLVALLLAAQQRRPRAPEAPAPEAGAGARDVEASPLDVADRVVVVGLKGQAALNGCNGQLVAMDGERWVVRLEGYRDSKKIKPANLKLRHAPVTLPQGCSLHLAVSKPGEENLQQLRWDEACRCFHGHLVLGEDAQPKRFTLLVNGQANACLHPDMNDACPFFEHGLRGPDANSQSLEWVVGAHPLERASGGSAYQVRVFITPDGSAKHLDWVRLAAGDDVTEALPRCEAPARPECPAPIRLPSHKYMSICGSWTAWALQRMTWNNANMCYSQKLPYIDMGKEGCESFQIVLDSDWKKVLHPTRQDACLEMEHRIAGPDEDKKSHGFNWAIAGRVGEYYEVRLNLSPFDGGVESIEWFQITALEYKASIKRPRPKLPKFSRMQIVGSWTDWKQFESMTWNADRQAYLFDLVIGRDGQEKFQIVLDGHWTSCLHPDEPCSNPVEQPDVCGPDGDGDGKDWIIGKRKKDMGAKFQICLTISADGCAQKVDWRQL